MRRQRWVVTAVVLSPVAVLAVWVMTHWGLGTPSGDVSLIGLRTGDVGTSRTPLVGSYQRFGFNQPGPLLLYLLALPYRLSARRYAGLSLGALVVAALSVVLVLRVAWRRGERLLLLWAALLVSVLVHGFGPAWLVDPWEPHVLALVGVALFALVCDVALGRVSSLVWVVVAASLIGQAWGTMLVFAVVLAGWAVAAVIVWAGRSPSARRSSFRSLVVAGVVGLVLWLPPVLDQLTQSPGNVTAALDALGSPAEPAVGLADGFRAVRTELGVPASWLGWPQRLDGLSPTLDLDAPGLWWLGLVTLVAATALAASHHRLWSATGAEPPLWRSKARDGGGMRPAEGGVWVVGVTAMVAVAAATVSMARLLGPLFVWLPQWLRIVGMVVWLASGWCLMATFPPRARVRAAIEAVLAAGTLVFVALTLVDVVAFDPPKDPLGDTARRLVDDAAPEIEAIEPGPVLVTSTADAPLALGGDDVALEVLVDAIERQDRATRVRPDLANKYGRDRADADAEPGAEVRLVRADEPVPPGFRVVADRDPLTERQRARRTALLAELGLPADATDGDALRIAAEDRSTRTTVRRLRQLPDLPPLRLLLRELADES